MPGPRPLEEKYRRSHSVRATVTPDEARWAQRQAKEKGITVSDWLRGLLQERMEKDDK